MKKFALIFIPLFLFSFCNEDVVLKGVIKNASHNTPVPCADILVLDQNKKRILETFKSDSSGRFTAIINKKWRQPLSLLFIKTGYFDTIVEFKCKNKADAVIPLKPVKVIYSDTISVSIPERGNDTITVLKRRAPIGFELTVLAKNKKDISLIEYSYFTGEIVNRWVIDTSAALFDSLDSIVSSVKFGTYKGIIGTDPGMFEIRNHDNYLSCINCVMSGDSLTFPFKKMFTLYHEIVKRKRKSS